MDNVAGWILEVDRGSLLPYEGNYSSWLVQKQKRLDMEHSKQVRSAKFETRYLGTGLHKYNQESKAACVAIAIWQAQPSSPEWSSR